MCEEILSTVVVKWFTFFDETESVSVGRKKGVEKELSEKFNKAPDAKVVELLWTK